MDDSAATGGVVCVEASVAEEKNKSELQCLLSSQIELSLEKPYLKHRPNFIICGLSSTPPLTARDGHIYMHTHIHH